MTVLDLSAIINLIRTEFSEKSSGYNGTGMVYFFGQKWAKISNLKSECIKNK